MDEEDKERFLLLEQRVKSLEALLKDNIARTRKQYETDRDNRTEFFTLMKGLEDRLNLHGKKFDDVCDQIDIHHDDLNKAYEIFGLVETRLKILEKHDDEAQAALKPIMQEQVRVTRELMRLDDAYYHVFPDRLAQDIRVYDQLAALNIKPLPDANPKKE